MNALDAADLTRADDPAQNVPPRIIQNARQTFVP
jgi:hypothetical protein